MGGDTNHIDLIWLSELNFVVLIPQGEVENRFVTAAVIVKGEDGIDQFIPYDGFIEGAPLGFSLGQDPYFSISVLGFQMTGEPIELASLQLDEDLVPHLFFGDHDPQQLMGMHVVGFGESSQIIGQKEYGQIGIRAQDYEIQGGMDYSDLLAAYFDDIRSLEDERFTGYFVTAVPRSREVVGPAVHLKPLNHYQFSLSLQTLEIGVEEDEEISDQGAVSPFSETGIFSRYDNAQLKESAGAYRVRDVPEFTFHAGVAREPVDFILRSGFQIHWRRQLENWSSEREFLIGSGRYDDEPRSFTIEPIVERDCLFMHEGQHYFRWMVEDAVIGDVVGVVFSSEHSSIDMRILSQGRSDLTSDRFALFLFMGDEFVLLTEDMLQMAENRGIAARLEQHIDQGLKEFGNENSLTKERIDLAQTLFSRDHNLQKSLGPSKLDALAESAPFGPELMVYRDHILRVALDPKMAGWINDIFGSSLLSGRMKLLDVLSYEQFVKAPALAHALVFNLTFRQDFQKKPLDPHSMRMPVLEYLLSKIYSDNLIDWAMRLKGESQAVLWHLALKRPHMVERLYELKMEPDVALNPFDDKSLEHAEVALSDSSHIDASLIEDKVLPILMPLKQHEKIVALREFLNGLKYGAEGKALNIGELSACLGAVEQAEEQWQKWTLKAKELFEPLITPLEIEIASFETAEGFTAPLDIADKRRGIERLIVRLNGELGHPEDHVTAAVDFIETIEASAFLSEIFGKLDLALKYHHDLTLGVTTLYEQFETSKDELRMLMKIREEEWPQLASFGPTFSEPFVREQLELATLFQERVVDFAGNVHPDDDLFTQTLKDALVDLEEALPKLVWLRAGQLLEERKSQVQKGLKEVLLEIRPTSTKLRRSKTLAHALRQLVIAERLGPAGWPNVYQALEIIEKNIESARA